jgi:ABC-type tungstate transport system substrate-binding protein
VTVLFEAFTKAGHLLMDRDSALAEITGLSLRVSLFATLLAALIGLPLGGAD